MSPLVSLLFPPALKKFVLEDHRHMKLQQVADPGSAAGAPKGTEFFCFRICFRRKAPVSEVGAPQREILDPPLIKWGETIHVFTAFMFCTAIFVNVFNFQVSIIFCAININH